MAPRKQKGESAKGGGAKTGESSSKKTKVRDTLLADTRPGSGPQLEKEIEEANAMNEQVKKALLGYARFDILQNCDVLKFGKWNPRQLLPSQVAALGNSFLINGVDRFNYSYAMPLVMDKSSIEEGSYMPTPDAGPNLPELKLRDGLPKDFKITAAGGQHRVAALKDWYAKKKAQLEECIKEQQAILSADVETLADGDLKKMNTTHKLDRQELESILAYGGQWLVVLYDKWALRPDAPPRWTRPLDAPFGRAFWTRPPYMDAPLTATDVLPIYGWTRPSQPLDALFGCASKTDVPFWTRPSQPLDALFGCASKTDAPFGRAPHSHWTRSLDMPLRWTRLFGHAPHSHGRALWMHSSQPRTRSLDVPFWTRPSQPLDALFGRAFLDTPLTATDALPYMDGRAPHSHWMRSLDTPLTATGRTLHSHWTRSLDALFTATDALFGCAPHSHGCTPIYGWTHSSQPWMRSHIWMDVPLTATGCALHSHRCTPIYGWTCSSDMQHSHSRTPIIKAAQFVEELCKGSVVTSK
ncbi:hypothetical protein BKA83DRAFT_4505366 [Pisolithus microcarpus]|nr:hypothetical protein BKA83DRAFT_4505366 [Pisolithus microcarpus]